MQHQIDPVLGYAIGNRLHENNLNDKQNANPIATADHEECACWMCTHINTSIANSISINCYVQRSNERTNIRSFIHSCIRCIEQTVATNKRKIYSHDAYACVHDKRIRPTTNCKQNQKQSYQFVFPFDCALQCIAWAVVVAVAVAVNNIAPR